MKKRARVKLKLIHQIIITLLIILPIIYFGKVECRSSDGEILYTSSKSIHEMLIDNSKEVFIAINK